MLTQPPDIVSSLGYLGIFLSLLLLPIPQEIVLPLAGFMAAQGKLNLAYAVMSGVLGSVIGALPLYWAGRYIGEARLVSCAERKRWIKLSAADIQTATAWFNQHGHKAIFFSQLIPGMRSLIVLPAGISQMNLGLFLVYLISSASLCQGLLAYAGYSLGNHYEQINQWVNPFSRIVVIVVIAVIVWFVRRKRSNA
ncbi:MAG: alkaline phosphatase [Leptolyngbya sp.]|nr:MAG: alkaline phosphatase [Leptolyngbya sp.]